MSRKMTRFFPPAGPSSLCNLQAMLDWCDSRWLIQSGTQTLCFVFLFGHHYRNILYFLYAKNGEKYR